MEIFHREHRQYAYDVLEPEILGIVFSALVTRMTQDSLNLVFLLVWNIGIYVVTILFFYLLLKLFEVLNIVDIVWDLCASTGDADLVRGRTRFLLLLVGTGTIVGI